jgi:hypothetical protein
MSTARDAPTPRRLDAEKGSVSFLKALAVCDRRTDMTTPSSSKEKGHGRRLLVTLVVTTATAAITTGVALKTHQAAENAAPRIAVNSTSSGAVAAPAAAAFPRRVEWRDPWRRPTTPTEAAAMSIGNALDTGAMRPDPSLPSAAAALQGGSDASDEPVTF